MIKQINGYINSHSRHYQTLGQLSRDVGIGLGLIFGSTAILYGVVAIFVENLV